MILSGGEYSNLLVLSQDLNAYTNRLFFRIPAMLRSASLNLFSVKYFDLAYGAASGDKISGDLALENLNGFLGSVSKSLLSQDDLEIPKGHKISTEEERKQAMEQLMDDIAQEGFTTGLAEWIAQKPL
jgi:hypothetical protein